MLKKHSDHFDLPPAHGEIKWPTVVMEVERADFWDCGYHCLDYSRVPVRDSTFNCVKRDDRWVSRVAALRSRSTLRQPQRGPSRLR